MPLLYPAILKNVPFTALINFTLNPTKSNFFCKKGKNTLVLGGAVFAVVAQLVEHVIGNDEVIGSIPINGSKK